MDGNGRESRAIHIFYRRKKNPCGYFPQFFQNNSPDLNEVHQTETVHSRFHHDVTIDLAFVVSQSQST